MKSSLLVFSEWAGLPFGVFNILLFLSAAGYLFPPILSPDEDSGPSRVGWWLCLTRGDHLVGRQLRTRPQILRVNYLRFPHHIIRVIPKVNEVELRLTVQQKAEPSPPFQRRGRTTSGGNVKDAGGGDEQNDEQK